MCSGDARLLKECERNDMARHMEGGGGGGKGDENWEERGKGQKSDNLKRLVRTKVKYRRGVLNDRTVKCDKLVLNEEITNKGKG